ncbi:hypothetical protein A9977_07840 [Variovorax sp. UMC13]|nr:hypothetical protein [Variovorax sp. UMC13]
MRALRQRSSALTAEQTELKRAKREMIEAAPRDEKGAISDEHARMQIWKLTSRLYDLQTEILDVDREMDRLYELFAGSAPGAGRSGVGGKPKL